MLGADFQTKKLERLFKVSFESSKVEKKCGCLDVINFKRLFTKLSVFAEELLEKVATFPKRDRTFQKP